MSQLTQAFGAYGLALSGIGASDLLLEAAGWPSATLKRTVGDHAGPTELGDDAATISLLGGGAVRLERRGGLAHFVTPERIGDAELIHPFLAPAAAVLNHWLGRETFHAGAIVVAGRAWLVAGEREGGKSTTLAALAKRGVPVLADDLVVVDGENVLAGPRCVDLREESAHLAGAGSAQLVRDETRRRLVLGPAPHEAPLGGYVLLSWGDRVQVEAVRPSRLFKRLSAQRSLPLPPPDPALLLDLAGLPAFELTRPKRIDAVDATIELLDRTLRQ
jgi:hypothetical protein